MSKINAGGQAFPSNYTLSDGAFFIGNGMTMRDYFAAKAMQAYLTDPELIWDEATVISAAKKSYFAADAMIAKRENGE